ncbi:MAG TPA: RDD family protein [Thermoanaerobaculia bacterium]|nr:RDD family protein [Thermoanaerobaculia bacterium]
MSRRGHDDEPFLFDLPLAPEEDDESADRSRAPRTPTGAERPAQRPTSVAEERPAADREPLFDDPFDPAFDERPAHRSPPHRPSTRPTTAASDPLDWEVVDPDPDHDDGSPAPPSGATVAAARTPGIVPRLLAAGVDALLLATVAGLALVGATLLDARPGVAMLPGLGLLLLIFSFAYSVVPLAFWGATPGMAANRLVSRDRDGGPLTFGQTALRWFAGLVTLLLAGLPLLLAVGALGSRSLADRLSGSLTWQRP